MGVSFNKVAGLEGPATLLNFQRSCFPVKFAKLLRAPIFKNIWEQMLLYLRVILFTLHEKDTANNA